MTLLATSCSSFSCKHYFANRHCHGRISTLWLKQQHQFYLCRDQLLLVLWPFFKTRQIILPAEISCTSQALGTGHCHLANTTTTEAAKNWVAQLGSQWCLIMATVILAGCSEPCLPHQRHVQFWLPLLSRPHLLLGRHHATTTTQQAID